MNEPTLARRRELTILTKLSESFSNANLNLRHTLVDTLEERGIGEVVDEGMAKILWRLPWKLTLRERRKMKSGLYSNR